jgi:hypothetical protein
VVPNAKLVSWSRAMPHKVLAKGRIPIVVLANWDLADTVRVAHFPSIPADSRVIRIARLRTVCFSSTSGIAA